ncbi:unnamed protein product [Periconia digitata]|uniref:Uncharacterized protein n=1 Tax=Periconia digitata TaxID=1303443 RepID=A0A9W4UDI3_9PLEO|nr:unnamed protein product [Periconia digitata]
MERTAEQPNQDAERNMLSDQESIVTSEVRREVVLANVKKSPRRWDALEERIGRMPQPPAAILIQEPPPGYAFKRFHGYERSWTIGGDHANCDDDADDDDNNDDDDDDDDDDDAPASMVKIPTGNPLAANSPTSTSNSPNGGGSGNPKVEAPPAANRKRLGGIAFPIHRSVPSWRVVEAVV